MEQYHKERERELEVRDRFQLFSWGLRLKASIIKRQFFLEAVNDLKRKLRKVLYAWQDKKAEDNFMQLADLIINYDKDEVSSKKTKVGGNIYKKKNKKKISNHLQTVDEREELKEDDDDDIDSS